VRLLGSLERFTGVLIENYRGAFPVWLAPEQARFLPVNDQMVAYAEKCAEEFKAAGLRVSVDKKGDKLGGQIRRGQLEKVPFLLVCGNREAGTILRADRGNDAMRGRFRIGDDLVVELAETFRLMSDPTRLKIILACRDAPAAVNEMAEKLGISPSLVSHHLRLLRAARLLQADRRGRQVFYVVGDEHIRSMLADMVDHISEEEAAEGEA